MLPGSSRQAKPGWAFLPTTCWALQGTGAPQQMPKCQPREVALRVLMFFSSFRKAVECYQQQDLGSTDNHTTDEGSSVFPPHLHHVQVSDTTTLCCCCNCSLQYFETHQPQDPSSQNKGKTHSTYRRQLDKNPSCTH